MLLVNDRELLEAFRRGEEDALSTVYRHYAARVAIYLTRGFAFEHDGRCVSFRGYMLPFDLETGLSETFGRAFSAAARATYDGTSCYADLLISIAREVVLEDFARTGAEPAVSRRRRRQERFIYADGVGVRVRGRRSRARADLTSPRPLN